MSTNKKFRIQNGVDVADGGISINDVTVIGADGKVVPAAIADAVAGLTSADIADLQAQVSAILGTSPETLDTLQEIVTAFENADSTLTQAVADNTAAHTQNASDIAATNARTAGISTSSGSSNIQMTAEVDMDGNAVTNMADPSSAQDAATKAYVDAASSASSSDATTKADAAESAAKAHADAGDANLQGQISQEADMRSSADSALNAMIVENQNAIYALEATSQQGQADVSGDVSALEFKTFGSTGNGDPEFPTSQLGGGTPTLWGIVDGNTSAISGLMSSKADKTTVASDIATAKSEAASDASTKADAAQSAAEATASADATTKADAAKAHADAGDANLQGQIDLIVGSSPASLDTLQEIVTAFENADSTLTGAVAQNTAAHTANTLAIEAERDRAMTAETELSFELESQIQMVLQNRSSAHQDLVDDVNELEFKTFGSIGNGDPEFPTSQLGGGTPTLWGIVSDNTSAIGGLMSSKADKTTVASDIATAKSEAASDASTKADAAEASAKAYTDAAEARVANDINVETARAVAVEGSLQSQIDTVSSGGVSGRQALQDAIDAEVQARIAGDNANSAEVQAEEDARIAADNTLQSNIDTVSAAVEAITNGSPEQLNQLTELVAAYESADADLAALIATLGGSASSLEARFNADSDKMATIQPIVSGNTSDIAQEVLDRIAGDAANSAEVQAEASTRAAAIQAEQTARQNAITAETNARILADNGLQAQIDALDTSTSGDVAGLQAQITSNDNDIAALQSRAGTIEADYALQSALTAEISRATAAEGVNAQAISDEESRATAAEGVIASDLAQEVIDRQNADAVLQGQIDFIKDNTDPVALDSLTEIVAAFQAADGSITGVVNSNTGRITSLENNVGIIQAWNTDNVSEGQVNLYFTEARAKACVGADAGSCLDYNQASGKFSLDLSETAGALVPDNSSNADKLDGQHGSHYRIDVYDVNGNVVN